MQNNQKHIIFTVLVIGFMLSAVMLSAVMYNITISAILMLLPIAVIFVIAVFIKPIYGLWGLFIYSFYVGLLTKMSDFQFGTLIDAMLFLIFVSLLFYKKAEWKYSRNFFVVLVVIWSIYIVLQILNPLAPTYIQWIYASRPFFYQFILLVLIGLVLLQKTDLKTFVAIWFIFSCSASIYGFVQKFMWPNLFWWEMEWLARGYFKQHVLFGKLRIFSHYTDAGQFGIAMGHALTSSTILFIYSIKKINKVFFAVVTFITLLGMLISGTRGALFVPSFGLLAYFIISKNWKILILGFMFAGLVYSLLVYTSLGHSIYEIRRMRTALDLSNNKSLEARIINQIKLKDYLADKPFGGGIGSSAYWGKQFAPNSFLANIPTDSLYVRIWAETGIIGLIFYILILLYIVFRGGYLIWNIQDQYYKKYMTALWAGLIGIFVANYGNMVMSQFPTTIVAYLSMGVIFKAEIIIKEQKKIKS